MYNPILATFTSTQSRDLVHISNNRHEGSPYYDMVAPSDDFRPACQCVG